MHKENNTPIIDNNENDRNSDNWFLFDENKDVEIINIDVAQINDNDGPNDVTLPCENNINHDSDYDVEVNVEGYIDDDMYEYELYDIAFENLSFERKTSKIKEYIIFMINCS